jgi:serine/threonine-protein kinase
MNDDSDPTRESYASSRITIASDVPQAAWTESLLEFAEESVTRPLIRSDLLPGDSFDEPAPTELVGQTLQTLQTLQSARSTAARSEKTIDLARKTLFVDQIGAPRTTRFAIRGLLGEGSFGRVYLAYDQDIGRDVAVKVFKEAAANRDGDVAREVQIAGRIDHPGVPPIYDVGRGDDGHVYCVMKRLHAIELAEIIDGLKAGEPEMHRRYPFYRRGQMIVQLLRILVAAHIQGILHRDIKPKNLLVGASDELMLIDWGIAVDMEKCSGVGRLAGTPWYMAPEQVARQPLDGRTDVFAVGAVLYEFLCLQEACPKEQDVVSLLAAIPTHKPPQMDRIHHPVQGCAPSEYLAVVNKALARKPDDRFASAADMLRQLEDVQAGVFNAMCPRTTIKSRLHRLMRWLDRNPERNVVLLLLSVVTGVTTLTAIGLLIGLALAG